MPRRRKTSPLEEFVSVLALLPWWAAVLLGFLAYYVLHRMAVPLDPATVTPSQMSGVIARSAVMGMAYAGQYIVPLLCFVAAVMSAVGRHKRNELVSNVAAAEAPDALDGMTWQQFEVLVGEGFRLQGYAVTETGGGGADGGVDLVIRKGTEKFLVQCKHWRAFKVGVQPVRELYGVMAARGAVGGFVVTSGRFTEEASAFASGRNLTLIDGPKLQSLIQQAQKVRRSSRQQTAPPMTAASADHPLQAPARPELASSCPACSGRMVLRKAKRGARAGADFWGCSSYPSCKGTRPA